MNRKLKTPSDVRKAGEEILQLVQDYCSVNNLSVLDYISVMKTINKGLDRTIAKYGLIEFNKDVDKYN